MLACPGGFDGGVEREQVGLVGDAGDRLEDPADLVGLVGQLVDPGPCVLPGDPHPLHDVVGRGGGVRTGRTELLSAPGRARHLVGQLAAVLEHHRLALGTLGHLGAGRGDPGHGVGGLIDVLAHLAEHVVHALRGVDEQPQRLVHGRLELGRAVGQVVPVAANLDHGQLDAERGERVEVERVGDRLEVVVEDRADRPLGGQLEEVLGARLGASAPAPARGFPGPLGRVLAQLAADRIEVGRVAAEIPLERQVDLVVQGTDAEQPLEVGQAERLGLRGLGEDGPPVRGLRGLPPVAQGRELDALGGDVVAEELLGGGELEVVIGQLLGDRFGHLIGPGTKLGEERHHVGIEADELAAQGQILGGDVVQPRK